MASRTWRTVAVGDVRLTPAEKTALSTMLASDYGSAILTNVTGEFLDALAAVGTPLSSTAGAIPDMVREHVLNRTRWSWICELNAAGKAMQTAERKALNEAAEKMLADIYARKVTAPPGDGSSADQTAVPSITVPTRQAQLCHQNGL